MIQHINKTTVLEINHICEKKEHQSDFLVSMFKLVKLIIRLYIFTVIILN